MDKTSANTELYLCSKGFAYSVARTLVVVKQRYLRGMNH